MLGKDGNKMLESRSGTARAGDLRSLPHQRAGRVFLQPPWTSIRYSERAIKESIPEFLLRLWHIYSFFVNYATINGFDPAAALVGDGGELEPMIFAQRRIYRPIAERSELDRWILSELHRTRGRGDRADGCDRQFRRLRADHGVCRRACRTGTSAAAAIASGAKTSIAGQARRLLDAVRMPADDARRSSPRSCRFWPRRAGRIWRSLRLAAG